MQSPEPAINGFFDFNEGLIETMAKNVCMTAGHPIEQQTSIASVSCVSSVITVQPLLMVTLNKKK